MWAARQPKVITSNCTSLDDFINAIVPNAKQNHREVIPPRVAECEYVKESLYSGCAARSDSQYFLPYHMSLAEAATAIQDLFN